MTYPSKIYRYFTCERALEFLKTGRLRLGSPATFNDPFELLPSTTGTRRLLQSITAAENEATSQDTEQSEVSVPPGIAAAVIAVGATASSASIASSAAALGLGVAFPGASLTATAYALYKLWKNMRVADNKLAKSVHDFYRELVETFRIGCFSEIPDSLLMWAHYGRNYTGVVVGFRTAMDYWGNDLFEVEYSSDRIKPPSSFEHTSGDPLVYDAWQRRLLTTKSECWSYEHEWRVIKKTLSCEKDEVGQFITVNRKSVTQVIMGHRIASPNRKAISDLVKADWQDSRIAEAWPHDSRFALSIDEAGVTC